MYTASIAGPEERRGIYFFCNEGSFNYANNRGHKVILVCRVEFGNQEVNDKWEYNRDADFVYQLEKEKHSLQVLEKIYRSSFEWKDKYRGYLPLKTKETPESIGIMFIPYESRYKNCFEFPTNSILLLNFYSNFDFAGNTAFVNEFMKQTTAKLILKAKLLQCFNLSLLSLWHTLIDRIYFSLFFPVGTTNFWFKMKIKLKSSI